MACLVWQLWDWCHCWCPRWLYGYTYSLMKLGWARNPSPTRNPSTGWIITWSTIYISKITSTLEYTVSQYLTLGGCFFLTFSFCNIGSLVASVLKKHEAFWQKIHCRWSSLELLIALQHQRPVERCQWIILVLIIRRRDAFNPQTKARTIPGIYS